MHALAGVEVPQWLACLRVYGFEGLSIIAEKDKATRGGHRSPGRMSRTHLGIRQTGLSDSRLWASRIFWP